MQVNGTYGTCDVPPTSPPPPAADGAATTTNVAGGNQPSEDNAFMDTPAKLLQSFGIILGMTTFLTWF